MKSMNWGWPLRKEMKDFFSQNMDRDETALIFSQGNQPGVSR